MTAHNDDVPHAEPTVVRGRVNLAPSDPVPPGPWPPGHPDQRARPARPISRTWWILPYCAGALAVFLVSGLIIGLRYNSGPAQPAGLSTAEPMPAQMFPDALFGELSADIQAGNETAFLGLASASARPAITRWWDNLEAIGFTTGAVLPTAALDAVSIDSHGNGSTVVLAGAHSPLDPASDIGKPQIPMAHYQIGLHFASPGAIGQITSWRPLDDAPWDSASPLYVRKAAYVVVAGPSADRALIDQTLPVAETAAAYDIKMMGTVANDFLQQRGFVVFVSGSATVSNGWFATEPQPSGWPPQFLGARAVQLPGPGVSQYYPLITGNTTLVNSISDNTMGGVRVVLTPPAAGTTQDETQTLVRDFMLDIQASHDERLANAIALQPTPSWTEEGLAVAVQSLFEANPDPVPAKYNYDWATLTAELRALPRGYRSGVYPSTQQLFGPSVAQDEAWGDVAASTYEYINSRYNITKMMVSGMEVYLPGHVTPFANVYKSGTNANNLVFFGIHSIRLGWQPWLARI